MRTYPQEGKFLSVIFFGAKHGFHLSIKTVFLSCKLFIPVNCPALVVHSIDFERVLYAVSPLSTEMIKEQIIVYTSGTFDMFHRNHLKMLQYARGLGDKLIVGVSTDELVCSYKAPPIVPFEERIAVVEAIKYPDVVIPQRSLDHEQIIKKLHIDVFVVGDDWTGKYDYLEEFGVKVFYFPYGAGVSSTKLKEKIYQNYMEIKKNADKHGNPDIR
ncbi:MAG: adenylyltransferase/cytidyltransferase family protein [Cytophagales bacterium]|nr:adenylyltransferase/cytidyltransferase family protein [Cytophagales bacterium]